MIKEFPCYHLSGVSLSSSLSYTESLICVLYNNFLYSGSLLTDGCFLHTALPPRCPIYNVCHRLVLVKPEQSHLRKYLRKLRSRQGIMRCPQLRILALIIGWLVHQSMAASFYCNSTNGIVKCLVALGNANDEFYYDSSNPAGACSGDSLYCVTGMNALAGEWDLWILNNDVACFADCTPILQSDDGTPYCSVDAC